MTKPALLRHDGSALVTAMLVMMLFLTLGVTTLALVDSQQKESGRERVRESSFALSEGVLNSQIYLLSRQWPGEASQAYSGQCTVATSANPKCPDQATMLTGFTGNDYNAGLSWTTEIHDNTVTGDASSQANFYDEAAVRAQPQWDSNRDGFMWVRAQGLVRGKRRTMVALVKAEDLSIEFPRNAVVAGKMVIGPSGNQNYVATDSYVTLRCSSPVLGNPNCRGWTKPEHVGPNAQIVANTSQPPALSPEKVERLRETAKAMGTYYPSGASCPPINALNGALVFIERSNDCEYADSATGAWNTQANPGVLVIGSGKISFTSNKDTYFGLVYNVNGSDKPAQPALASTGTVILVKNACIFGSVVIDGLGGFEIGSNNGANYCDGNMKYDANGANRLKAFGTAGIVQNSFREISATD